MKVASKLKEQDMVFLLDSRACTIFFPIFGWQIKHSNNAKKIHHQDGGVEESENNKMK